MVNWLMWFSKNTIIQLYTHVMTPYQVDFVIINRDDNNQQLTKQYFLSMHFHGLWIESMHRGHVVEQASIIGTDLV